MSNRLIDKVLNQELQNYFSQHPDHYDELSKIINSKSNAQSRTKNRLPSLRGLEYVVTYLSRYKGGQGFYSTNDKGERIYVDIHNMYKTTLGTHGKKRFDSFRRTTPITFSIAGREDAPIETTVAQLWWGKWIYEQNIMQFIKLHWTEVRKDMAETLRLQRKRKRDGEPRLTKKRKMYPQQIHTDGIVVKFK